MEAWTAGPKSKKHKKKKASNQSKPNGNPEKPKRIRADEEPETEGVEGEEHRQQLMTATVTTTPHSLLRKEFSSESSSTVNGDIPPSNIHAPSEHKTAVDVEDRDMGEDEVEIDHSEEFNSVEPIIQDGNSVVLSADTESRLDALAKERTALRDEVAQLRRSLEQIQGKHEEELGSVRVRLEETQGEKEQAETQYRNLLGRVNTIRSQLGERLKADAVRLGNFEFRLWNSLCVRKTCHKPELGLKSLKISAEPYVNKMKLVLPSWPLWQRRTSSGLRNCQVFGTGTRYLSKIGPKKGKISSNERLLLRKSSRLQSKLCRIGRY